LTIESEIKLITIASKSSKYWSASKVLYAVPASLEHNATDSVDSIAQNLLPAPWSLEIYPTMACQLRCIHCYAQKRNEMYHFGAMPTDMMDSLHESIRAMGIRGVQYCGGGEPLSWQRGHIVNYIAELPHTTRAGMASNMVAGDALASADVLRNLTFLEVPVFAYDEDSYVQVAGTKGANAKVKRSLINLFAERDRAGIDTLSVNAKLLINRFNYQWLPKMYDSCLKIGFDNIHLRLVDDYEKLGHFTLEDEQKTKFRHALEKFALERKIDNWVEQIDYVMGEKGVDGNHSHCWSVALGLNCWVLSNGEVYICGPQWGNKDFCIGSLRENSLEEIWGGPSHLFTIQRLIRNMTESRCFEKGCRHIKQSLVIDSYLAGNISPPSHSEFDERHAWFL
jgi:MoaA/NifB/PqqE/SkfB family radical SAM enzyme